MIITRITLENYKQYRGEHTFPIAEEATIGVIGANGVGKTTIFEAIEWCLYKPSTIKNADIRPRNTGGEVRVVVQLTTQSGNEVYEVERVLKRSATQATVYKLNEFGGGDPLVQGTREVTDYITTKLIGLGHSAFVATFFTRQKELGFFDDLGRSDRRREVGKLLGFETIKQAQAIIAEERSRARADADALQRRYDAQTSGRNLDQEIEQIAATISERTGAVTVATKALAESEQHLAKTEQTHQQLQEQRDLDAALAADLRDQQSQHKAAIERRDGITQELEHLDARQDERSQLESHAARLEELAKQRRELEAERDRFQRRQQAQRETKRLDQELSDRVQELHNLVDRVSVDADATDWAWSDTDASDPVQAIERLISVAIAVNVSGVEQRCGALRQALAAAEQVQREQATLEKYLQTCEQLHAQVAELVADGDPAQLQQQARARLEELRSGVSAAHAEIDALTTQQERSRQLVERLGQQHFDDICPTCGRPIDDNEAELVVDTMNDAIAAREESIASLRQKAASLSTEAQAAQKEIDALRKQENTVLEARTRITNSAEHVERKRADVQQWQTTLSSAMDDLSLTAPPTSDQIEAADRELGRRQNLHQTLQPLQMIKRTVQGSLEQRQHAEDELAALADVSWDADLLATVTRDHDQASRAVSAIEQIDRQLARRPQLQHDLASATTTIERCDTAIAKLREQRDELGFNATVLQASSDALKQARQQERAARDQLHASERDRREAEFRLESVKQEQQQLADLAREAEERRRAKEELDVMYSEFSEFDRFVAQHLSPVLSETTSDIVAEMTDGKYDRVTFDEDYGIEVFDQSDEGFPLETFSGGERDAVSLAARLAMSRMIGQQAANPPGFLVLDEVFGSLDADRRERVLSLLGQQSTEHFRQMFIISHVDDVQQSPVFDTIWQIEERDDGSSQIVTSDGAISREDL